MTRVLRGFEPDLAGSGISPFSLFSGFFMRTSARNALRGTITAIRSDTLAAEIAVAVSDDKTIFALITKESLRELGLCVGREAIVLINNRRDRMRRAVDMAQIIAQDLDADWYVITGDRARTFIDMAARYGVPRNRMINMGGRHPEDVLQKLFELTQQRSTVMGIGNMGGFGVKFVSYLEEERNTHAS